MSIIQQALQRAKAARSVEHPSKPQSNGSAELPDISRDFPETAVSTLPAPKRKRIKIDWQVLRDAKLLAPVNDDLLARQIRDIKRPLIAHAFGKRATTVENGRLIMVTSALAGEGKTFISFNLARSMAEERDHTVLIIDADVAKPHTSMLFGLAKAPGLLDLLENPDQHVESYICDTDIPGLSILPAGKPRTGSTELLASSRMENLAKQLTSSDRSRIVLFDSPPVLQTSESKVLAEFIGQIVLVVGAEHTPKGAVAEAAIALGEDKAVNLVLNKATSNPLVTRYGYGSYGSDFREGASVSPRDEASAK
jgi:exopolysaccharide/PEP-CTERM locus tyrosine autokinase